MCRSKAHGGRRCTGHSAFTTSSPSSPTTLNVASGNDMVGAQGRIFGRSADRPRASATPLRGDIPDAYPARTVNIAAGSARVGVQGSDPAAGGDTVREVNIRLDNAWVGQQNADTAEVDTPAATPSVVNIAIGNARVGRQGTNFGAIRF
ncbi:hypothetical protein [Couchioplanes caeruleus]|uniref:Uncharacterized protein n=2 Tax=Couchioplanes caeruleus TaxID=56438 RepID=A0A1K0FXI0_9ACTN|nr:hypothetical protein [Couchioplanes caeruleus]OJF09786.1 hypothetical protein BG844_35530 [Couchioplanes caeruleus subsp. caeruleus]ROP31437.1 hypothetical protein EDD30_4339 [Couchioplanes caeruleus]